MNEYTQDSPPRRGTARKIWDSLAAAGVHLTELHYNPNCWGASMNDGWGTWACSSPGYGLLFCGWSADDGEAYLRTMAGADVYALASTIAKAAELDT